VYPLAGFDLRETSHNHSYGSLPPPLHVSCIYRDECSSILLHPLSISLLSSRKLAIYESGKGHMTVKGKVRILTCSCGLCGNLGRKFREGHTIGNFRSPNLLVKIANSGCERVILILPYPIRIYRPFSLTPQKKEKWSPASTLRSPASRSPSPRSPALRSPSPRSPALKSPSPRSPPPSLWLPLTARVPWTWSGRPRTSSRHNRNQAVRREGVGRFTGLPL
jgi:hypothetical protein